MAVVLPDRATPQQVKRGGRPSPFRKVFKLLMLIVIVWAATWILGFFAIRSEIIDAKTRVVRQFPDAKASIRAPFPFVISYRIKAQSSKAGVKARYSSKTFYWWFFATRRIPDDQIPPILNWIWLF